MEADRQEIAQLMDEDFTTLGGLNQIRWAASQHRALQKLKEKYSRPVCHDESVAADYKDDRNAECEGVLTNISGLKFVKMLVFLLDVHEICKIVSKQFQRQNILLIEIKALLKRTLLGLENLCGGKGKQMLLFTDSYEETGKYKGVELNRVRHETRSKSQACMEQFSLNHHAENEALHEVLFKSYDFYVNVLTASLKQRFSPFVEEPLCFFEIFDYTTWPDRNTDHFSLYGDKDVDSFLTISRE